MKKRILQLSRLSMQSKKYFNAWPLPKCVYYANNYIILKEQCDIERANPLKKGDAKPGAYSTLYDRATAVRLPHISYPKLKKGDEK
jgi:hypothetical protein